jgi:hypothetical protein
MATGTVSPSERIAAAYQALSKSAKSVNQATEELAKPVSAVENALRLLNLGVACWVKAGEGSSEDGNFWNRQLGYALIERHWRLAIKTIEGNEMYPDREVVEEWAFNEAPLYLRLKVVDKLPDLLEAMVGAADATARRLREKAVPVQEQAAALNAVINPKRK